MNILRNIAVSALFLGLAGTAFAQEEDHKPVRDHKHHDRQGPKEKLSPEERADEKTKRMTEELELTESQAEEVKKVNLEHFKRMEEMRAEKRAFMKEMMEQKKAHKQEMKEKMKTEKKKMKSSLDQILTEEQKKKRDEKRAENCPCCNHDK